MILLQTPIKNELKNHFRGECISVPGATNCPAFTKLSAVGIKWMYAYPMYKCTSAHVEYAASSLHLQMTSVSMSRMRYL